MTVVNNLQEERTRVICNLPTKYRPRTDHDRALIKSCRDIIKYVKDLQIFYIGIDGYTKSKNHVFRGKWWTGVSSDSKERKWEGDDIIVITIDYRLPTSSEAMNVKMAELRAKVSDAYRRNGAPQQEVWILAHDAIRQCKSHPGE